MAGASDQTIFDMIRKSGGYKAIDARDKAKVEKALNNQPSNRPSSWIGQAAWELAKRDTVGPPAQPPPEPPPTAVLVAPITVTQQGGSDQRVCLFVGEVEGGPLRPGVRHLGGDLYADAVATYRSNGLEEGSVRTKLPEGAFGLVKAREMDGRNACQCPTSGDPAKNSGSWTV